ncbi:Oligosaccharide translocation protein rft1 [Mactra antiquata]
MIKMAERKDSNDSKLLSGAVKAASYNMVLQLMLRVMTFLINGVVLRFISKDMLGVVNVRLTLLYSTTLFLATEAFDKACLSKIENQNWSKIINLMWCTVPMSIIVSSILGWTWIYLLETPDSDMIPNYTLGVISFSLSTVLVILSRPLYILGQKCMFIKLKVVSAGIAEIFKCIITVILVIFFPHLGIINFAVAQIIFGLVTSLVYYGYFIYYILHQKKKDDNFPLSTILQLFPSRLADSTFIDINQAWLAVSIFTQSFFKQLLTEGEKYVMTIFGVLSFADQGIYDIVNNLGSMAARFIFLPIEESGYLFFSQLLVRGEPVNKQKQDSCQLAVDVLSILLKMVILIGIIILMFGVPYSYLALDLYGGSLLSSGTGPTLLRWYCLYVLIIAVNGTTECFVFATMSKVQVDRYSKKMVIFSGLFLLSSIVLVNQFGSVGFILANCLNMGARIVHSIYYIHQYFKDSNYSPLHDILPSNTVILVLVISLCITSLSEMIFCCDRGLVYRLLHIVIGGICFIVTMATIYMKETTVIKFIKDHIGGKHKQS